ncbi:MAG: hypothetical protein JW804_03735 [Sedimentisphaerales bacterium]|nr:hypothetical protein [Sedimentisphaerales bacterium]
MKKMIFVLTVLLLVAPAMAGLTISCNQKGSYGQGNAAVEISYVATADANIPRGLGLEVTVDSGVTVTGVESASADYWVYPGSIVIDTNDPPSVADYGTPIASGQGTSSVIIEMGSLHYPTGNDSPNAPDLAGTLITLNLSGTDCNVSISGNGTRGNVVDYDAAEMVVGEDIIYGGPCYIAGTCFHDDGSNAYKYWLGGSNMPAPLPAAPWERPVCWCYPRQCRGDINGQPISPGVQMWVSLADLTFFRTALNKMYNQPATWPTGGECADLDHAMIAPTVPIPVSLADLTILRLYLNKMDIPWNTVVKCCDSDTDCVADGVKYNFWTGSTTTP